jgi:hypothetical protein
LLLTTADVLLEKIIPYSPNRVIRESQETEARKVNEENQALQA